MIILDIKKEVNQLIRKFGTNNPYDIARELNISVTFEELGSIYGYYNSPLRMKQIHINQNLPEHLKKFTCAHELGHAIMHPKSNTPFLKNNTFLSVQKMEIEANKFATELLISDDVISDHKNFTTGQLAALLGYSEELIMLRMK